MFSCKGEGLLLYHKIVTCYFCIKFWYHSSFDIVSYLSFKCALELTKHASFLYTSELDTLASCCFKALEGSNYDVRICVAELLGVLMAFSQKVDAGKARKVSLDEVFTMMSAGFLRGSVGFLKGGGGELLKSGMNQEVRVGVTQVRNTTFSFSCSLNILIEKWMWKKKYLLFSVCSLLSVVYQFVYRIPLLRCNLEIKLKYTVFFSPGVRCSFPGTWHNMAWEVPCSCHRSYPWASSKSKSDTIAYWSSLFKKMCIIYSTLRIVRDDSRTFTNTGNERAL